MVDRAHPVNAPSQKLMAKPAFTMQSLWRLALWGSTASVALLVAILTTRSEVGSQRAGMAFSLLFGPHRGQAATQVAQHPFDAESAARQLAQAVRGLAEDRDRLMTRLAAVEHNMDDMTGSITRQIEEAKARTAEASVPPWPNDAPPLAADPATLASVVAPVVPAPGAMALLPPSLPMAAADQAPPDGSTTALQPTAYGVDIGGAASIQALHTRWAGTRSAHPELFAGLQPFVTLKQSPRSNRVELRLVVGPLPSGKAAAQLCASLAAVQQSCQPTMFKGEHFALQ